MSVHKLEFKKIFNELNRRHNGYTVFRDFVTMSSISIQNSFLKDEALEEEYFSVIKKYSKKELDYFPELFAKLTFGLELNYGDFLGDLFMELEIGEAKMGQFFTPYSVSRMLSEVTAGDFSEQLKHKSFITLSEPACGAGGMVIAFAEVMKNKGFNPQNQLFVECWDLDNTAAYMCYLQLSLLGIPAKVVIGNTLSQEVFKVLYTPMYYMGNWNCKLNNHWNKQDKQTIEPSTGLILNDTPEITSDNTLSEQTVQKLDDKPKKRSEQMSLF